MIKISHELETLISQLYFKAKADEKKASEILKNRAKPFSPTDMESFYLAISRKQGEHIMKLIVKNKCKTIVEFGTSFEISTIFLGIAAQITGGEVVTSELVGSKVKQAITTFVEAGLERTITLLEGDAIITLKQLSEPIDFLLMDGWKNLYLPVFKMLEPLFHKGTLIYADNANSSEVLSYLSYIYSRRKKHKSKRIENEKVELTVVV